MFSFFKLLKCHWKEKVFQNKKTVTVKGKIISMYIRTQVLIWVHRNERINRATMEKYVQEPDKYSEKSLCFYMDVRMILNCKFMVDKYS